MFLGIAPDNLLAPVGSLQSVVSVAKMVDWQGAILSRVAATVGMH